MLRSTTSSERLATAPMLGSGTGTARADARPLAIARNEIMWRSFMVNGAWKVSDACSDVESWFLLC